MPKLNGTETMFSKVVRLPEFDRDMKKRLKKQERLSKMTASYALRHHDPLD